RDPARRSHDSQCCCGQQQSDKAAKVRHHDELPDVARASVPQPALFSGLSCELGLNGHGQLVDFLWLWFGRPHSQPNGNDNDDVNDWAATTQEAYGNVCRAPKFPHAERRIMKLGFDAGFRKLMAVLITTRAADA